MKAGVFLDRDGVLCENRADYVKDWTEFRWIPGAADALRTFARLELPVVLVTNQSAINRGLTTSEAVRDLHRRMGQAISQAGGRLDGAYVCPHRPEEGCACRKPGLLLFRQAAAELDLEFSHSFLIGDGWSDLEAGWGLGVQVILVRTGLGVETAKRLQSSTGRVHVVENVLDAGRWIESTRVSRGSTAPLPAP